MTEQQNGSALEFGGGGVSYFSPATQGGGAEMPPLSTSDAKV